MLYIWLAFILLCFGIFYVHWRLRGKQLCRDGVTTLIVVGSGGHTAELIRLICKLDFATYHRHYILANNDTTSEVKISQLEANVPASLGDYSVHKIPRSRKVGQSYFSAIFTTLFSTLYSTRIVFNLSPDLVLCNGPGTCVPICIVTFAINFFLSRRTKIVFVESICRVKSLSLSGRILRYIADYVIVQWPELQELYPETKYFGRLF